MMMSMLFRSCRRQLHTIVSRDIIKPSSPTPSHLKTYNLSLFDQVAVKAYIPFVTFYPSSGIYQSSYDKTLELKNSLSHTLSRYYPFAGGRLAKVGPAYTYVECNDEGVDFIEASNDSPLSEFLQNSDHKDLDQLFPDDLVWYNFHRKSRDDETESIRPLSVQVNHFSCGGIAVAVSLSHNIGDGSSCLNFFNHWATVTRSGSGEHHDISHINPLFLSYQTRNVSLPKNLPDGHRPEEGIVTRSFVFPDSKINDLKAKITSMAMESGEQIVKPTRAEALTWLIQKCAVAAASKRNSGIFKPTGVAHVMNLRNNMVEGLPTETSVGNLFLPIHFPTRNESELMPSSLIGEMRKKKKEFRSIRNTETALGIAAQMYSDHSAIFEMSKMIQDYYVYSVLCRFPIYCIDFGWGKPIKETMAFTAQNATLMMDIPNEDGIDALVSLHGEDMKIFQSDPELLAYC